MLIILFNNQLSSVGDFEIFLRLEDLREHQLLWKKLSVVGKTSYTNVTSLKFQVSGLAFCNLSHFPDFLRYQDKLKILDLSKNSLVGKMPRLDMEHKHSNFVVFEHSW